MIRILLIPLNDLKSHPTASRFMSLGKSLIDRFDVDIIALRYKRIPTAFKANRELNFQWLDFNDMRTGSVGSYYIANALPIFSALSKLLKKNRVDLIIHANIVPSTIAVGLGKLFHIPTIFDYQDHFPESAIAYFKSNTVKSIAYSLTNRLNKINIKCSDAVVTITDSHRKMIKDYGPEKLVEVIPNGVDTDLFKPIPRAEALKKLNMQNFGKKKLLVYFGSIDPWLDFSLVFEAIKRLVNRGFDPLLLIIGFCHSEYYIGEIRKAANDMGIGHRVHILDPVPQNQLVNYINAADVTLAPYRSERALLLTKGLSQKIIESLACGRPVCTTGIPETIRLFKEVVSLYSSADELESAFLEHMLGETKVSVDQMTNAVKEYSWGSSASSYYSLIKRVINKH